MAGIRFRRLIDQFITDLERQGAVVVREQVTSERPARIRVANQRFIVFLWTITPGGGPHGTRPDHERRIQITNVTGLPLEPEARTIVGGWSDEADTYAFWDARRHVHFSQRSPSFQVSVQTLDQARHDGLATQNRPTRSGAEVVVAVNPDSLFWYLQAGLSLHNATVDAASVTELISAPPEAERDFLDTAGSEDATARRYDLVQVVRAFRASRFRPAVLRAYSYRCAVCRVALKLVEAAHIVPVAHPGSTDEVTNGLALCRLHHAAYDNGLLGILPTYGVSIHAQALQRLSDAQLDDGIDKFQADLPPHIHIPSSIEVRPTPQNLRRGLLARGWTEESF